jgi:hypothetical protein
MLVLNLVALFACFLTRRKNIDFFRFVIRVILRLPSTVRWSEKLKIARIAARNVGIYELVHRYGSDRQVVIADEGTLQIAHYLFVHVSSEPSISDLETFTHLVALPDFIVHVLQDEHVLIKRTQARGHKRIPAGTYEGTRLFVSRAVTTYATLIRLLVEKPVSLIVVEEGGMRIGGNWELGAREMTVIEMLDMAISEQDDAQPTFDRAGLDLEYVPVAPEIP